MTDQKPKVIARPRKITPKPYLLSRVCLTFVGGGERYYDLTDSKEPIFLHYNSKFVTVTQGGIAKMWNVDKIDCVTMYSLNHPETCDPKSVKNHRGLT